MQVLTLNETLIIAGGNCDNEHTYHFIVENAAVWATVLFITGSLASPPLALEGAAVGTVIGATFATTLMLAESLC